MKKWAKRIGVGLGVLVGLILVLMTYFHLTWPPRFADTPYPNITSSSEPAVIARGNYIVHALAHCSFCHMHDDDGLQSEDISKLVPSGGHVWKLGPLGTLRSPNLTSDAETGLGKRTDAEIARVITTGIRADGHAAPMMLFIGPMHERDLTAVVSYLRSLPAVVNKVPASEIGFVGRTVISLAMPGIVRPGVKSEPPPFAAEGEISLERGRYLAEGPAYCVGCHSDAAMRPEFELKRPYFQGGGAHPDPYDESMEVAAPNLTTHAAHGRLATLTEEQFVARFRQSRTVRGSPMPWESYKLMLESDLRSIYRYLASLAPIDHNPGPQYRAKGWKP